MTHTVSTLSELPIEVLNDIRLCAAVCRNANPMAPGFGNADRLIEMCNDALEMKQAMRLEGYEDIEPTFV